MYSQNLKKIVHVRLSEEEFNYLIEISAVNNLPVSEVLRKLLLQFKLCDK